MIPLHYERIRHHRPQEYRRHHRRRMLMVAAIVIAAVAIAVGVRATSTIRAVSVEKTIDWREAMGRLPDPLFLPSDDKDRTDILLLGLRGANEEGGFLTDSIMVVSADNDTGRWAMLSIPRDLYVPFPDNGGRHKINEAYQTGLFKYGNGLAYAKAVVAYVTGLPIDVAAAVDLNTFHELVGLTNGVTITLTEPFTENRQWYCDETGQRCAAWGIEAGTHRISGETLDLYVRSRFSSSDFDRARRQQQVLVALKDELLSLGFAANPIKVNDFLNTVGRNIKTDAALSDIGALWDLTEKAKDQEPVRYVFDSSPEGLLEDAAVDGVFVLVPKGGMFGLLREKAAAVLQSAVPVQ